MLFSSHRFGNMWTSYCEYTATLITGTITSLT